jgi:hypothetical protein
MSSTTISKSTHTLHIQRIALPSHCISESTTHCYSETWRSGEDMYLAKNTSASCLSSLSEKHRKLFSSSSSWHGRLGGLDLPMEAWPQRHGAAAMAASVPTCQWKFLSNHCATMAAAEAESHGGAALRPSDSAIVLGEGGSCGPVHRGHARRGASMAPCLPPCPASCAACARRHERRDESSHRETRGSSYAKVLLYRLNLFRK